MKLLFSLFFIILHTISFSQNHKIESQLIDKVWILKNATEKFNPVDIQGSDGYWEIEKDSMIITSHCYQWETYHKIEYISADSLVLRVYNRIRNEEKGINIQPTSQYYYFSVLNKLKEEVENLWKKTIVLTHNKRN